MGVLLVRQLWWLTNLLCFSRNLAFAFADSEPHGDPPQQTCGAYKGSTCDTILMSTVMTETTGMFCLRCVVAATLGGVIGAQREFSPYIGKAHRSRPRSPSRTKNARPSRTRRVSVHGSVVERVRGGGTNTNRNGRRNKPRDAFRRWYFQL